MEYKIIQQTLVSSNPVDLTESDFEKIKRSHKLLMYVASVEQLFQLLIENHREWEQELLYNSLSQMIYFETEHGRLQDKRAILQRRLVNFLTSVKMYQDQITNIPQISGFPLTKNALRKRFTNKRNNSTCFSFIYELRNYAQHRGLPFDLLSQPSEKIYDASGEKISYRTVPFLRISEINTDDHLSDVVREFSEGYKMIDISHAVRVFIEEAYEIHLNILNEIEGLFVQSSHVWDATREAFSNANPNKNIVGLAAVAIKNDGSYYEKISGRPQKPVAEAV